MVGTPHADYGALRTLARARSPFWRIPDDLARPIRGTVSWHLVPWLASAYRYVMVRLPPGFELEVNTGRVVLTGNDALSDHYGVFSELRISRVDALDAPGAG